MVKRKETNDGVEPMVIALAEQLGTFLGRVQKKADGWLENEALRQQVSQIRDGATQLLERVNQSSVAARKSAIKVATAVKSSVQSARKAAPAPPPTPPKREGEMGRSGGTVDAPGKKHRKPPPQESIDRRMGEPVGKQMGQKQFQVGKSRGRG